MGLTLFNQWKQHAALSDLNNRLATAESELEFQRSISVVISGLNPYEDIDQRALQIIGRVRLRHNPDDSPDVIHQIMPDNPRRIKLHEQGNRRVVIFCHDTHSSPGVVNTVAALIENDQLVDIQVRESNTRIEWHTTTVEDSESGGEIELVFNCRPGGFALQNPQKRVSYTIGPKGFGPMIETTVDSDAR